MRRVVMRDVPLDEAAAHVAEVMPTPGLVIGVPANDSTLLEIVTLLPPDTLMAFEPVFVIVKPEMVMLFRPEMANALVPPLMVTPEFAAKVTPEFLGLTAVPG